MFPVINGLISHISDRTLSINGLLVDVPKRRSAYIGIELSISDGELRPHVCEMTGPSARRYRIMQLGDEQLRGIKKLTEESEEGVIPFGFTHKMPRMRVTVN